MNALLQDLLHRQRKLFVTGCAGLTLAGGFVAVAFKPEALGAYKVLAEWVVYLAAFFGGANALSYWTQGKGGGSQAAPAQRG